jgi:hypothetical protein
MSAWARPNGFAVADLGRLYVYNDDIDWCDLQVAGLDDDHRGRSHRIDLRPGDIPA